MGEFIRAYNAELLHRHWDAFKSGDLIFFSDNKCAIVILFDDEDVARLNKEHVCFVAQQKKEVQVYNISIEDMEEMDVSEDEEEFLISELPKSEFDFFLEKEKTQIQKNVFGKRHSLWNNGSAKNLTCFACLLQRYKNIPLLLESVDEFRSFPNHMLHKLFFDFFLDTSDKNYWTQTVVNDDLLNLLTGTSNKKGVRLVSLIGRVSDETEKIGIRKLCRFNPNSSVDIVNFIELLVNIEEFDISVTDISTIANNMSNQFFWSDLDYRENRLSTIQTSMTAGEFCLRALQTMKILRTLPETSSCQIFRNALPENPHKSKKHVFCSKESCHIYFSNDLYYAPEIVLTIINS